MIDFAPPALKHGWHPNPMTREHVLCEVLYIHGQPVALLEAFADDGPWYCNAVDPTGTWHRLGAGISQDRAMAWAERITGYSLGPPMHNA